MSAELPSRREFSKSVAHHVLSDIHWNELFAIMDSKRVTHELWGNHRRPAPGFDNLFLSGLVQLVYLPLKFEIDEWTFF